jgi:hypothetical protein
VEKLPALPPTLEAAEWALNGNAIFYLAQSRLDAPPGYADLYRYDLETKTSHDLSDGFHGSIGRGEPVPLTDGSVVQLVDEGFNGKVAVYSHGVNEPAALELEPHNISAVSTNFQRSGWIFLGSSGGTPEALYYTQDLHTKPALVKEPTLARWAFVFAAGGSNEKGTADRGSAWRPFRRLLRRL